MRETEGVVFRFQDTTRPSVKEKVSAYIAAADRFTRLGWTKLKASAAVG